MTPDFDGRKDRPAVISSETHRIETGYGVVYVTIGFDDGDMFEVFIQMGRSGGFSNAWAEALAKTISNALRSGVEPEIIIDDLLGIRMDKVSNDNGDRIKSIPDGVGIAMKRAINDEPAEPVRGDAE